MTLFPKPRMLVRTTPLGGGDSGTFTGPPVSTHARCRPPPPSLILRPQPVRCRPAPLPREYARFRGRQGKCRTNSLMLAFLVPALTYVEGLAMPQAGHLPVAHAWCMDSAGRVVEPTWDEAGLVYVGTPLLYPSVCSCILDPRRRQDIDTWAEDYQDVRR